MAEDNNKKEKKDENGYDSSTTKIYLGYVNESAGVGTNPTTKSCSPGIPGNRRKTKIKEED